MKQIPWDNDKDGRIETGPVRFGDDWNGTFVRGDNSFHIACVLEQAIGIIRIHGNDFNQGELVAIQLESYANLFKECIETNGRNNEQ